MKGLFRISKIKTFITAYKNCLVSYKGKHTNFILDLGKVESVNTVEMDFLNVQAQANWHLLILPKYVTYSISEDGENYSSPTKMINPHNPDPAENPEIVKTAYHRFKATFMGANARFIKVHAQSPLKMPPWHINAGKLASL
jgi:hypothetical protein